MTANQPDNTVHDVLVNVLQAKRAGAEPTPVENKQPVLSKWPTRTLSLADCNTYFGGTNPRYTAYGIRTGSASGNLIMVEIEGTHRHLLDVLEQHFRDHDGGATWDELNNGCTTYSPSGGVHFMLRIEGLEGAKPEGSKRLARTEDGQVIAETRGQNAMFVGPGSSGHPTGNRWTRRTGGWDTIPKFTVERYNFILDMFRLLDEYRKPQPEQPAVPSEPSAPSAPSEAFQLIHGGLDNRYDDGDDGLSPGSDFNQRADWQQDLLPDWPEHSRDNHYIYLTRPGKSVAEGPSATISLEDQRLYVFTTSTEFESEQPYSKFGAFTLLTEGSTSPEAFSRAASRLRKLGYGTPRKTKTTAKARNSAGTSQGHAQQAVTTLEHDNPTVRPSGQVNIAYRLEAQYTNKLMYVGGMGWFYWDSKRWALDRLGKAKNAVLDVLTKALAESINDEQLRKDVRSSERASAINGVLDIASALPGLRVPVEALDADPYLLNTKTGTLDLRTLELYNHNPADRITKITGTGYDPNATAPEWEKFLPTSLPDPDVRGFLQRYVGLTLVGKVIEHVLVIATGYGRNGKGVIAETVSETLGDYAITANNHMLIASRYKQQSAGEQASLMRLRGARWADMSEIEKGDKLAESTMKRLTGGDTIEAKYMHQNPVEFKPSHSFFMLANDLPKVDSDDPAIWARMLVIPFDVSFIGREDHGLKDRLKLELAGVLAWAVRGWSAYQQQGLNPPAAVSSKTDGYRFDNDAFAQFIDDRCVLSPHESVTRKYLNEQHQKWAIENGVEALNAREMVAKVSALEGVEEAKIRGVRLWKGLGVKIEQSTSDMG